MDGRFSREAVTSNMSPVYGADRSGLPAAINSAVKMFGSELPGGAPVDLRASRSAFVGPAGTDRLAALIQAFLALGGNMMTLTVTDAEELRSAMRERDQARQQEHECQQGATDGSGEVVQCFHDDLLFGKIRRV